MDLAYWGFRHWPFERTFAADRFFSTPTQEEALARLLFLVEECRRTGIVVGPGGTGKTFLLKLLQQRAERLGRLAIRCEATGLDSHELIGQIAIGCHVPCDPDSSTARVWNGLQTRFAGLALVQQPVLIVVDHFDLVEFGCQQAVCRLGQLADSIGLKLTIVLATRDRCVPFGLHDIVELKIDIGPWTTTECGEFINSSVSRAGSSEILFTEEAVNSIHELTNGIPANVVTICNLTLLATMGRDKTLVTSDLVEAAASELPPIMGDQISKRRISTVMADSAR